MHPLQVARCVRFVAFSTPTGGTIATSATSGVVSGATITSVQPK